MIFKNILNGILTAMITSTVLVLPLSLSADESTLPATPIQDEPAYEIPTIDPENADEDSHALDNQTEEEEKGNIQTSLLSEERDVKIAEIYDEDDDDDEDEDLDRSVRLQRA